MDVPQGQKAKRGKAGPQFIPQNWEVWAVFTQLELGFTAIYA